MMQDTLHNVLVVGNGAREHALVWKLLQSPQVGRVFIAPGNAGTAQLARCTTLDIAATDVAALVQAAKEHAVDFAVIGPESSLAVGIVDALNAAGIEAFGPVKASAQLESSKAYAKYFMQDAGIPTADFAVFTDYEQALAFVRSKPFNEQGACVVKADGLAAGKGVAVCTQLSQAEAALHNMMQLHAYGSAGGQVVIEALLPGREISILAFCDGTHFSRMPAARDHKRLLTGDQGPNTGGMGAFSPVADINDALLSDIDEGVFKPFLAQLKARGLSYCGVIYAGLMIDDQADGTQNIGVLEFNCRFGDPETQVLMGLLDDDLLSVMQACTRGKLNQYTVKWHNHACLTVVMAAKGYPDAPASGDEILLPQTLPENVAIFHAGTQMKQGKVVTSGGRVLSVTAWAPTLSQARQDAYTATHAISFAGAQYRSDISLTYAA